MKVALFLLLSFLAQFAAGQSVPLSAVTPIPYEVKETGGEFSLSRKTTIVWQETEDSVSASLFNNYLAAYYGFRMKLSRMSSGSAPAILLGRSNEMKGRPSAYSLHIDQKQVVITAADGSGIFYALQTLKQILPVSNTGGIRIRCGFISDYPRYEWRGMMLDVSRHFFSVDEVKQFIDYLAAFKLNTFHWHLTDDQGWRIEIKKYPKLTQVGAWRNGTLVGHAGASPAMIDTIRYVGFYTQEQIRDVVAYAAARFITVVPEIEMPGHAMAALAAYPELACSGSGFEVAKTWGVFDEVMCPTPFTMEFVKNVMSEVMDLFPSTYIHIGGDECPKTRWKESAYCQQMIEELGLKDENGLQAWFTNQVAVFAATHQRKIIGWDEILAEGLTPSAAIMSWQGISGGLKAAQWNHPEVMSPTSHMYFDYYQSTFSHEPLAFGGYLPVDTVYAFKPAPPSLTEKEKSFILGAQANLWTEYIPDFRQVEYMIFPRLCALAEVVWSPAEKKNFNDFTCRLTKNLFPRFDQWGLNYSRAVYQLQVKVGAAEDGLTISLSSRDSTLRIRYALTPEDADKSNSVAGLIAYSSSISITKSGRLLIESAGSTSSSFTTSQLFDVNKATGKSISLKIPPAPKYSTGGAFTLVNGIHARLPWHGSEWLGFWGTDMEAVIDLGKVQPISQVQVGLLDENGSWIYLPKEVFVLLSDDGKNFSAAGQLSFEQIRNGGGRNAVITTGNAAARYIKVVATNYGIIPEGHPGAGFDAWLFVDEIAVR